MAHSKDVTDRLRDYLQELKGRATSSDNSGYIAWDVQEPRQAYREVTYVNGDAYKGEMLGNQRHGQGTHTSSNGDVYQGGWRLDQRHGTGRFTTAAGLTYDGEWVDDKTQGQGRCSYPDGSCYEGEWHQDQRQGWGCYTTSDGQRYEGEWHHDTMHGQGEWRFADGRSYFLGQYVDGQRVQGKVVLQLDPRQPAEEYQGEFQQGKRQGQGAQVVRGAYQYSGAWREDQRCGLGTCTYADGSVYEGEWCRDVYHGQGCFRGADGSAYDGTWVDGKQHGQGRARLSSGDRYVGSWQQGQRHGQGKCAFANGDVYIGQWLQGKQEGEGVCNYATGDRFKGTWAGGQRHGQGLMIWADGTRFKGQWEEGAWVQSAAEPALCRLNGPGLARAAAGQLATFKLQAYDEKGNKRLSGGEAFSVLLAPVAADQGATNGSTTTITTTSGSCSNSSFNSSGDHESTLLVCSSRQRENNTSSPRHHHHHHQQQQEQGQERGQEQAMAAVHEGSVVDHGDGSYTCSYKVTRAGRYMLHVVTGDSDAEPVADSPYPVLVLPGEPSFRCCTVEGLGRHQAQAGSKAAFSVTVRDACDNLCDQLTAQQLEELLPLQGQLQVNSKVVQVDCCPQPKGTYTCCYTAPAAGLGVLELTVGGRHLRGSPFSVQVNEPLPLTASEQESAAAAAALEPQPVSSSSSSGNHIPDLVAWWGQVAEQEYAAVDGDLTGFNDTEHVPEMQTAEQEYAERHPHVPVVERLEDLWLLQKLQQDRAQQQATKDGSSGARPSRPATAAATGAAAAAAIGAKVGTSKAAAPTARDHQEDPTGHSSSEPGAVSTSKDAGSASHIHAPASSPSSPLSITTDSSRTPASVQLHEAAGVDEEGQQEQQQEGAAAVAATACTGGACATVAPANSDGIQAARPADTAAGQHAVHPSSAHSTTTQQEEVAQQALDASTSAVTCTSHTAAEEDAAARPAAGHLGDVEVQCVVVDMDELD